MKIKYILLALLCGMCTCLAFAIMSCKDGNKSNTKEEQNGNYDNDYEDDEDWTKNY